MRFHTHLTRNGRESFILATLEGGEGAGKTTQMALLKEKFPEASFYREPGSTEFGKQMRAALMAENVSARAQAFAFLAARAELTKHIVYEDSSPIVFIDRFIDSTMAYQGYGSDFTVLPKSAIEACNFWATAYEDPHHTAVQQALTPTMTFLLNIPLDTLLARVATRGVENKYDNADSVYHTKVLDGYDKIMLADRDRFIIVDGLKEPAAICDEIATHVQLAYDAMKLQPRWMR